jgi:hypothetical protein
MTLRKQRMRVARLRGLVKSSPYIPWLDFISHAGLPTRLNVVLESKWRYGPERAGGQYLSHGIREP